MRRIRSSFLLSLYRCAHHIGRFGARQCVRRTTKRAIATRVVPLEGPWCVNIKTNAVRPPTRLEERLVRPSTIAGSLYELRTVKRRDLANSRHREWAFGGLEH